MAETFSGYDLNSGTRIKLLKANLTINTVIEDKSEDLMAADWQKKIEVCIKR